MRGQRHPPFRPRPHRGPGAPPLPRAEERSAGGRPGGGRAPRRPRGPRGSGRAGPGGSRGEARPVAPRRPRPERDHGRPPGRPASERHGRERDRKSNTSELQSRENLVCSLLLEKKKTHPLSSPSYYRENQPNITHYYKNHE